MLMSRLCTCFKAFPAGQHFPRGNSKERPGFCPSNDLPASALKAPKCHNDSDCLKPAKCCPRGSTKDCLPAVKEKPGKCPKTTEKCEELSKCENDKNCPDDLKCCDSLIGKRCLKPQPILSSSHPERLKKTNPKP
ncbi:WAP four-disulfide core domain protein 5-like isoform X2 [Rhinatrema bivittatum]|uniref:WAP four-disulfide core domain protein 5-like isoform X2 n=1 Tax=Rhinatrema bivittatum TaxID=194408 RepID=UPI00112BBDF2|nr:WAP four-disulfide core domain protein 5-like isoform X2 [Rhinatrema bivittatum]